MKNSTKQMLLFGLVHVSDLYLLKEFEKGAADFSSAFYKGASKR